MTFVRCGLCLGLQRYVAGRIEDRGDNLALLLAQPPLR